MIVTNSFKLAKKARLLKNLAYGIKNRFMHSDIGFLIIECQILVQL